MTAAALLAGLVGLLAGWLFGWMHAHSVVASECLRLGRFFVGDKVFHCVKVGEREPGPAPYENPQAALTPRIDTKA